MGCILMETSKMVELDNNIRNNGADPWQCKLKKREEIRSKQKGKLSFVKKKILVQNLILVC